MSRTQFNKQFSKFDHSHFLCLFLYFYKLYLPILVWFCSFVNELLSRVHPLMFSVIVVIAATVSPLIENNYNSYNEYSVQLNNALISVPVDVSMLKRIQFCSSWLNKYIGNEVLLKLDLSNADCVNWYKYGIITMYNQPIPINAFVIAKGLILLDFTPEIGVAEDLIDPFQDIVELYSGNMDIIAQIFSITMRLNTFNAHL